MINPAIFINRPLNFGKICKVFPPTLGDVLSLPSFGQYKKLLTITQEDLRDEFGESMSKEGKTVPTPFEFLLINCYHNVEILKLVLSGFKFFIHEDVYPLIEDKIIVVGNETDSMTPEEALAKRRVISEENYFDFQNFIRMACGDKIVKPPEPEDPNEDPRIRRIKAKARMRDRIKAKQGVQGKGISLETCLVAICCMGIGITPLNIGEMSYAALFPLLQTYQEKEKYDLDVRAVLAGADSKKIKPKYWIRNTD